jgi:hypothetical protein
MYLISILACIYIPIIGFILFQIQKKDDIDHPLKKHSSDIDR